MTRMLKLGVALLLLALGCASLPAASVRLVGQLDPLPGSDAYGDAWAEGDLACIGAWLGGSGVGIIDISTPSAPRLLAHYNPSPTTAGRFQEGAIRNRIGLFVSDNGGGLHVVNLTNPASPSLIVRFGSAQGGHDIIHSMFLDGDYLYEADHKTPVVKVISVRDPAAPFLVRNIVTTSALTVHKVTVIGTRLYCSNWDSGTDIYDVTDIGTRAPTLLGTIASGAKSHSTWATPDNRYLVSTRELDGGDLRIYDIANPDRAVLVKTITSASLGQSAFAPHNAVLYGKFMLVSWFQAGLQVFDFRNPAQPVLLGSFDTYPDTASGYKGTWGVFPWLGLNKVLLTDRDYGLFIVDLSQFDQNGDGVPDDGMLPMVSVASTDTFASEWGDTGLFTVTRVGSVSLGLTVNYSLAGTAVNGLDYVTLGGSVTIPVGARSATVPVTPISDGLFEGDETVVLTLNTNAAYIVGTPASATVTISDNDFTISTNALTVPEGGSAGFTVHWNGLPAGEVTVTITRTSGDDSLGVSAGARLTFTPANWSIPQTVTLSAAEDIDQSNGQAVFTVSAPGVASRSLTATAVDNDIALQANFSGIGCGSGCSCGCAAGGGCGCGTGDGSLTAAAPLAVLFNDLSTGVITNRVWQFGDGSTTNVTETNLVHIYSAPGTNSASLTVYGPAGSSTQTRPAYVIATNPPPLPPSTGPALALDGVDDYVNVPDSPSLRITGAITIEAWIKRSASGVQHSIVEKYGCSGAGGYLLRVTSADKLLFSTRDDCNTGSSATGATSIAANAWTHVAGVWDGAACRVYVNGVLDGALSNARNPMPGTTPLRIGARANDLATPFSGQIDEVRVWGVARTAAQILTNKDRCLAGNEPGLAAYWRFDAGQGTTAADATANQNDGALINGPVWSATGAPLTCGSGGGTPGADAPSRLSIVSDVAINSCVLSCIGPQGVAGVLEVSLDLTNWSALRSFTNVTGLLEMREPMNTLSGSRFFRVRQDAPPGP